MKRFWREFDWIAPLALTAAAVVASEALIAGVMGIIAGKCLRERFPRKAARP